MTITDITALLGLITGSIAFFWAIYRDVIQGKIILWFKVLLNNVNVDSNLHNKPVLTDYTITLQIANLSIIRKCIIDTIIMQTIPKKIEHVNKNSIIIDNYISMENSNKNLKLPVVLCPGDKINLNVHRQIENDIYEPKYNFIEQLYKKEIRRIGIIDSYLKRYWINKKQFNKLIITISREFDNKKPDEIDFHNNRHL